MKDLNARLGVWIWVLIYAGMFAFALGVALVDADAPAGHVLWIAGVALVVVGITLIGVRARRVTRAAQAELVAETSSTSLEAKP